MAGWRSEWQQFKKQYPDFEQSKFFKSDVGPQMDSYEKACDELKKGLAALTKRFDAAEKAGKSLLGALTGYGAVLKELEKKGNKTVSHDFGRVMSTGNNISFDPIDDLETAGNSANKYRINFQKAG